jgi:trehalose synthase
LWRALPRDARRRVHLALLPMIDPDENAVMVNALQRRADVVAQTSLAEGFGLTVSEAMWKGRPVVASRVGGIQDQIEDGRTGHLVAPDDLEAFGACVTSLLADPHAAERTGERLRPACATTSSGRATWPGTSSCSTVFWRVELR